MLSPSEVAAVYPCNHYKHIQTHTDTYIHTYIQIEDILTDEARVVEKSRCPLTESQRIDKDSSHIEEDRDEDEDEVAGDGDGEEDMEEERDKRKPSKAFDLEVYDDRNFYSLLLKVPQ